MYDFDKLESRLHTSSTKWDRYEKRYHINDVIPLWVADMDFECMPEIRNAIKKRVQHPIYGYTDPKDELYQAVIKWEKMQHHIDVEKEDIIWNTGVVHGIYALVNWLVKEDEKVIIQTPVYPPFFKTPKFLKREVVYNPLKKVDGIWRMDLQDFEKKLKEDDSIRMFILCNPHNPVGRCFTKHELEQVLELCECYDVLVISDEIHADIVMPGKRHVSIFECNKKYYDRIVLLGSATKSFNLAGLKVSYAIIKNLKLKEEFAAIAKASGLSDVNLFAMEAMTAAYNYGEEWIRECCEYIWNNYLFLEKFLAEHLPEVTVELPEATYLAWVDFRKIGLGDFTDRLKFEGHVELQGGAGFGKEFEEFQRINLACPKSTLEEGLKRLVNWISLQRRKDV